MPQEHGGEVMSGSAPGTGKDTLPRRRQRIALLVGNAAYPGQRLANPVNDVRLIERTMRLLDFDVEVVIDATKAQFETAIVRFGERIEQAELLEASFFYYAGHGVQYQGDNFLLPIDAEIQATRYLKSGAVKADAVVEQLALNSAADHIVVFDACRNNPIPEAYNSTRDVTQGLADIRNTPSGTLITFSTGAGKVALDGDDGPNSPYAAALAHKLALPGRRILEIFGEVNGEVGRRTNGRQVPAMFLSGALPMIVLRPISADVHAEAKTMTVIGNQIQQSAGQFVSFNVGVGGVGLSGKRAFLPGNGVHKIFKDIDVGPEMVVVPAGTFTMGTGEDEYGDLNERPAHAVTIVRPFAVGRCCVTVNEYRSFVDATGHPTHEPIFSRAGAFFAFGDLVVTTKPGRNWRRPGFAQTDDHPVVGVSWADANAYVTWLAARTGQPYRLLSEAEWEYAARAGSSDRYAWGRDITRARANFDDDPELRRRHPTAWRYQARRGTCPAVHYDPNAWGLFNMHGNVAEWVEDDWHEDYQGATGDGTPRVDRQADDPSLPALKVIRGGSWDSTNSHVRSASRSSIHASWATSWIGFRVARDINDSA